jgi:peptidoglycan/LPS O-acetylase OafA/YrhL
MGHRYRSMDFFRSIAILMVILSHSILSYGAPQYLSPLQLGGTGVDLFFVLSGWLLGGQLFKEINIDGNVSIRKFWIRRWMRTLPAYYAVLMLSVTQRLTTKESL